MADTDTKIALIQQDISFIKDAVRSIDDGVKQNYTPIDRFVALEDRVNTMHRILGTLAGFIAAGLLAAILRQVLK